MPLRIAASVSVPTRLPSACQTLLPKSRLPWQGPGAPRWEERRSNQEQTAKRLRREAGAFPPSPLASPHPHQRRTARTRASWEWGMSLSHTMAGTSLCEGAQKIHHLVRHAPDSFFSSCLCLSGISCLICFYFFPSHDPIGHPPWELSQIMCFFKKESVESKCTKTQMLSYFSRWDCS